MAVAQQLRALRTVGVVALVLRLPGGRGGGAPGSDRVPASLRGGPSRDGGGAQGCLQGVQAGTPAPFRLRTISGGVGGSASGARKG